MLSHKDLSLNRRIDILISGALNGLWIHIQHGVIMSFYFIIQYN